MRISDLVRRGAWPVAETYTWKRGRRAHPEERSDHKPAKTNVESYLAASRSLRKPAMAEVPGLFRLFAGVEPMPDSILAFANSYGSLDLWEAFVDADSGLPDHGDSLANWSAELAGMRHAVAVADALLSPRTSSSRDILENRFLWRDLGSDSHEYLQARYFPQERVPACTFRRMLGSDSDGTTLQHVSHSELNKETDWFSYELFDAGLQKLGPANRQRLLARVFVQTVISDRLALWVRPFLADLEPFRLRLSPVTFIGSLWLQFASSLEGGFRYRRCGSCEAWIEISPSVRGRGQNVTYCRDACRVRAWRHRNRPKARLARSGKTA